MQDKTPRMSAVEYQHFVQTGEMPGAKPAEKKPADPKYGNIVTWSCPECGGGSVLHNEASDNFIAVCCDVVAVKIDSKWEAERWAELHILQKAGEIRNLKRQVPIRLAFNGKPVTYESGRKMTYWVDFDYDEKCDGKWVRVLEDTKGIDTKDSKIKRALVHNMLDIRVRTNFRADRAG